MNKQRFAASDTLELQQTDGDVAIKGWDEKAIELVMDGDAEQCVVEEQDTALIIRAHIPLAIYVPRNIAVSIGQASGDLLLRDLDNVVHVSTAHGDISIQSGQASVSLDRVESSLAVERLNGPLSVGQAHGDIHLSQVGAVSLGQVHGDVSARAVAGNLQMGVIQGDVRMRDVSGPLTLEEGQGDFWGQDLAGGINVHRVEGKLSLKTALTPGLSYNGQANGRIVAQFPEGTSARLNLQAKGQISARGLEIESKENGQIVAQIGEGEAQVALRTESDLTVRIGSRDQEQPWGFSMNALSEQINAEIAQHIDKLGAGAMDLGALASREVEKAMRRVELEIQKAQRKAEKAAHRAQEDVRIAEERARRAQEKAQRKARQFQAKFERRWGPPADAGFGAHAHSPRGRAAGAAQPKPSREEQLEILKMLQEGKISTEEAEMLLKALGI